MPPKAKPRKKASGYQLPEKFDEGFVLKDVFKTSWTLGKPIGQGGFGLIYLGIIANKGEMPIKKTDDAHFVIKIEPKDNGPLFCETHFYANTAKEEDIKAFMKAKDLGHLGMPRYISTGLCVYKEKEYRFLVMDKYERDLQSFLDQDPHHQINEIGVLCLMRQLMFTLEYIHSRGYAHGDIKGANILLKSDTQSFLVDYGLVVRFERDGQVQKYQIKPERKHNGTIEYTSRDAHDGAHMEILGYCAVHWLSGTLPWIELISNNDKVHQSKVKSMSNVKDFISTCFKNISNVSEVTKTFLEFYLNEVNKLSYDSEPSYVRILAKINETLKALGHTGRNDFFGLFEKRVQKKQAGTASSHKVVNASVEEEEKAIDVEPKSNRGRRKVIRPEPDEFEEDEEYQPKGEFAAKGVSNAHSTKDRELKSAPSSNIISTSSNINGRIKQTINSHSELSKAPLSPLSLRYVAAATSDAESNSNCVLVKKRRNVVTVSVETQTDQSYVRTLKLS